MINRPTWNETEIVIQREISWLKDNILPFHNDHNPTNISDDYFYRALAILIVSGKVKATEYTFNIDELLSGIDCDSEIIKSHGSLWHDNTIKKLSDYLSTIYGFAKIEKNQPSLLYGYADIFINDNSSTKTFIEIDTVSIFKLWLNLSLMQELVIINIKSNKIIKFSN